MPRLRRSDPHRPGFTRRRRGAGFSYHAPDGTPVRDAETLARIRALVIPPAWRNVWICPYANGHIQVTGLDDAGRCQYIYHPRWRELKDQEKFERAFQLGERLPAIRRAVTRHLRQPEPTAERALAAALRIVDAGALRIGSAEYAETNGSFGVTTLTPEHVEVQDSTIRLDFPGKSGQRWDVTLKDRDLAAALEPMRQRFNDGEPEAPVLAYRNGDAKWNSIDGTRLNEYLRTVSGGSFTAKDFRTWQASVLTAMALARAGECRTKTARQRAVAAAMREVAEGLGNTPAVVRKSYVDPRIIDRFMAGETIAVTGYAASEKAVRALIED